MTNNEKAVYIFVLLRRASHNSWIMSTMSALSLSMAFFLPVSHGWLSLCFLLPLFYVIMYAKSCGFFNGLWWGLVFFGLHFCGFVPLFLTRSHVPCALLALLFLIIYCALHAGIWVWLCRCALHLAGFDRIPMSIFGVSLASLAYFMWMRRFVFWLFSCTGYPFAWPLLPLMHDARWMAALPLLGEAGLLYVLILSNLFFACALLYKRSIFFCACCAMLLPFVWGWIFVRPQAALPSYAAFVCYAKPPPRCSAYRMDYAQTIHSAIAQALCAKPTARIVLMPESTYAWALNHDEDIIQLWRDNALYPNRTLIIGAYYKSLQRDGPSANGVYCIASERTQWTFCTKSVYVPFVERVPWPWHCFDWCKGLFLGSHSGFGACEGLHCLQVDKDLVIKPLICSDLFLGRAVQRSQACDTPVLACFVNDSWFEVGYLRDLMLLFAKSQALQAQRDLLYISHYKGVLIGPDGSIKAL